MIEQRITQLLTKQFFLPAPLIRPDKRLRADLGLTSLDVLDLIVQLEQGFRITLPDDELDRIQTIGQLQRSLERHLSVIAA
jgi:acyl carrier protein